MSAAKNPNRNQADTAGDLVSVSLEVLPGIEMLWVEIGFAAVYKI